MLSKVGKLLRGLRLENDEILKDMAQKLNVSSAFLSAIENGKKNMSPKIRKQLIKVYEFTDEQIEKLDNAIAESKDSVIIDIKSLSNEKKDLAISFARSFGELSDEDVSFFKNFLKKIEKGG